MRGHSIHGDNEIILDEKSGCYRSVKTGEEIDRDELYVTAEGINWETDGDNSVVLPKNMLVPLRLEYDDDAIIDYLSNQSGWLVNEYQGLECSPIWKPKTSDYEGDDE